MQNAIRIYPFPIPDGLELPFRLGEWESAAHGGDFRPLGLDSLHSSLDTLKLRRRFFIRPADEVTACIKRLSIPFGGRHIVTVRTEVRSGRVAETIGSFDFTDLNGASEAFLEATLQPGSWSNLVILRVEWIWVPVDTDAPSRRLWSENADDLAHISEGEDSFFQVKRLNFEDPTFGVSPLAPWFLKWTRSPNDDFAADVQLWINVSDRLNILETSASQRKDTYDLLAFEVFRGLLIGCLNDDRFLEAGTTYERGQVGFAIQKMIAGHGRPTDLKKILETDPSKLDALIAEYVGLFQK